MSASNEWANDPDDVDHMPLPWWACPALGVLIAAAAVLAGSVGRRNRKPTSRTSTQAIKDGKVQVIPIPQGSPVIVGVK